MDRLFVVEAGQDLARECANEIKRLNKQLADTMRENQHLKKNVIDCAVILEGMRMAETAKLHSQDMQQAIDDAIDNIRSVLLSNKESVK